MASISQITIPIKNTSTGTTTTQTFDLKSSVSYGTCDTDATTAQKTVTTLNSNFSLNTGASVKVKFTYGNTNASPTLKIDNTEAKSIKAYGATAPTIFWKAGDVVEFTYDGTNFIMGVSQGEIDNIPLYQDIAVDSTKPPISRIDISSYNTGANEYEAPSDGYVYVKVGASPSPGYGRIVLYNYSMVQDVVPGRYGTVFVKKGCHIHVEDVEQAYFIIYW